MKIAVIKIIYMSAIMIRCVYGQQSMDAYISDSAKNHFVKIADISNDVTSPVDLDFYPNQHQFPFQLWVLNQGTENSGGSTVIISNAHQSTRTYQYIKDGNAWHFMSMASAIAFGDTFWATSADILDANHGFGKYAGPTLWPSDLNIYGKVGNPPTSEVNGSHLDMIHQSPYSKGIAFEKDRVYWVLDGYEGNLKRYEFAIPHEPGGSDHSDGTVQVYSGFSFIKHPTLPSHIVIDAGKKYLYGCDPVGKRIFRADITSGSKSGNRTKVNQEPLNGYYLYTGLIHSNIITNNLNAPVGIDVYGNRLIVTDNGTDEIIIFDIANNFKEIGRLKLTYTSSPDPIGLKIGPDGKIYFVDKSNQQVYLIENENVKPDFTGIKEESFFNNLKLYPNPVTDILNIEFPTPVSFSIFNMMGELIFTGESTGKNLIQTSNWDRGGYFIRIYSGENYISRKIMK